MGFANLFALDDHYFLGVVMLHDTEEQIRKVLIEVASQKTVISYDQLNAQVPLHLDLTMPNDRVYLGRLLETISRYEHDKDRPLLSALVIYSKGTHKGMPDNTFFELAQKLGRYKGHADKTRWLKREQKHLYEEWQFAVVRG
jgi:hypothetical protein